jgi:flagellar motor switch/type III secretory pathway protein FliN
MDWVDEIAPAQTCRNYPPELLQMLAEWTFQPLAHLLKSPALSVELTPGAVTHSRQGIILTIIREDLHLDILLQESNWPKLMLATDCWRTMNTPAVAGIPASLCIGMTWLLTTQCRELESGLGLKLQYIPDISVDELWLILGESNMRVHLSKSGHIGLLSDFAPIPVPPIYDNRELMMDNIPLLLTAEIGQVTMTLGELKHLQPGDVLNNIAMLDDCVQLKVNGYTIARGHLIQADQEWIVRVSACSDHEVISRTDEDLAWTP